MKGTHLFLCYFYTFLYALHSFIPYVSYVSYVSLCFLIFLDFCMFIFLFICTFGLYSFVSLNVFLYHMSYASTLFCPINHQFPSPSLLLLFYYSHASRWTSTAVVQQVRLRNLSPSNTPLRLLSVTVIDSLPRPDHLRDDLPPDEKGKEDENEKENESEKVGEVQHPRNKHKQRSGKGLAGTAGLQAAMNMLEFHNPQGGFELGMPSVLLGGWFGMEEDGE